MAEELKKTQNETESRSWRRDSQQQTEIGELLFSARAISRQMVSRAKEEAEEILTTARQQADELLSNARRQSEETVSAARLQADKTVREAEARAAEIRRSAEQDASAIPSEKLSAEMQDYAIRCVEQCMTALRQQQLDAVDIINQQWQRFLCGIMFPGSESDVPKPAPKPAAPKDPEVSQEDIEKKVSAIARELDDFTPSAPVVVAEPVDFDFP